MFGTIINIISFSFADAQFPKRLTLAQKWFEHLCEGDSTRNVLPHEKLTLLQMNVWWFLFFFQCVSNAPYSIRLSFTMRTPMPEPMALFISSIFGNAMQCNIIVLLPASHSDTFVSCAMYIRKQDSATVLFIFVWKLCCLCFTSLPGLSGVLQENRFILNIVQYQHEALQHTQQLTILYERIPYTKRLDRRKKRKRNINTQHISARRNVVEKREEKKKKKIKTSTFNERWCSCRLLLLLSPFSDQPNAMKKSFLVRLGVL